MYNAEEKKMKWWDSLLYAESFVSAVSQHKN